MCCGSCGLHGSQGTRKASQGETLSTCSGGVGQLSPHCTKRAEYFMYLCTLCDLCTCTSLLPLKKNVAPLPARQALGRDTLEIMLLVSFLPTSHRILLSEAHSAAGAHSACLWPPLSTNRSGRKPYQTELAYDPKCPKLSTAQRAKTRPYSSSRVYSTPTVSLTLTLTLILINGPRHYPGETRQALLLGF